jgi:2-amino-4-hydroxy-6-hydroxymethyldihydropteridine diphosphokinase
MAICYLGIGSNLGDRSRNIRLAIKKINALKKTKVIKVSKIIETLPIGGPGRQNKFLNAVLKISTGISAIRLLEKLKAIEKELGRKKIVRFGPRTIDLDILLFNDKKINRKDLIVPHPRIKERPFVLLPLKQIAPRIVQRLLNEDYHKN